MEETLHYKGYSSLAAFDATGNIFHGKIMEIKDLVTFEGVTLVKLTEAFKEAVDDYISVKLFY